MKDIYFDNAATTRCLDSVNDIMIKTFLYDYGNPSSAHIKGMEAEKYVKKARENIGKVLKANEKEIIFTSGGTEADNLAIIGAAMANRRSGMHIITTEIEHPAVSGSMKFLEEQGFSVTYLKVDENGLISQKELEEAITGETILVSVLHVNNEIGAVLPIEEVAKIIKEKNPNTLFHVDAIQSFGKYIIHPQKMGIDLLSASGHKIHGPKGIGFLYVKEKTKIIPILFGGGQQKGLRSGTENVPGIAGLGQAVKEAYVDFEHKVNALYELRERFIQGIVSLEWAHVNGRADRVYAPHIVSVSFDRVRSEVLLHSLEEKGIYVSAGSACASNKPAVSKTLKSIGVKKEYLDNTVRFSFCMSNTKEEIDYCIQALKELIPVLQRYTRH